MKRAVFLDRDGVLNKVAVIDGAPYGPRELAAFHLHEGVPDDVGRLKRAGFLTIVVTNQPDIARGKMAQTELDKMTAIIRSKVLVDDVVICSHDNDDACSCRKPKPGMLTQAAARHGVDLPSSYFVGDTWRDRDAGIAAGCTPVLIDTCYNQDVTGCTRVNTLGEAVEWILNDG